MPRTRHTGTRHTRTRHTRLLTSVAVATAVAATVVAPASAAADSAAAPLPPTARYVALGDSYTSGPGIPRQADARCDRSDADYPALVRRTLGFARFTDVSCAGATTDHLWQAQRGTGNPAQLDAVTPDTALVTLGIGAADAGLADVVARCAHPRGPVPRDNPCQREFNRGGTDELDRRIEAAAPRITAALTAVHRRAPHARVAVVGYPAIIGDDTEGCRTSLRLADGDQPYLRGALRRLNAMLRRQATALGDVYVNTHATTTGHDACRPFADRYVEGLTTRPDVRPAAPLHPNARGERAMAEAVVNTLILGPSWPGTPRW
ncbi:lipase [Streptomyces mashuensis]|uniref:Lipase n=1 Tax=Streptomyces mashuensis TaxID=33904 RepID=A0A919B2X0_9ACTN|nr:SGNH/GDSL hydrolase family protein [Streptomyces mashuensis]GHF42324.1 lipase [Streptomyces mashuensis]